MSNRSWVCAIEPDHTYTSQEAEQHGYFCPKCPYGEGILINREGQENIVQSTSGFSSATTSPTQEDLGLAIMLLDCSGSMKEPAFPGNPMPKKDLIAKSVAAGIFSLSGNPLKEFAYVLILGFDHQIDTLLPYTSIKDIVRDYQDAPGLEKMLREKMHKMEGATDINSALSIAFNFTQQFINSEIAALGNYKPRIQMVIDENMMTHQVPNVRVLLFTDGEHFLGENDRTLNPSPFKNLQYDGKVFDLLMSAYYGDSGDHGYFQLKSLVSKCPRHPEVDQFFLFNDPTQVANLKGLFRMASGASGFCPTCLSEGNTYSRDL
jgi:hypothetical protein